MAYDKVVDSSVLNNNLTAIADAIREKAGVEDSFAFPAGFVEAIAGISAGNIALPSNVKTIAVDTYVLASAKQDLTVPHSLGERPSYMLLVPGDLFRGNVTNSAGYYTAGYFSISMGKLSGAFKTYGPHTGDTAYASSNISSIEKKNTQTALSDTSGRFTGPSSNFYPAGEYMVISVKLNVETME